MGDLEEQRYPETSVTIYQTTWRYIADAFKILSAPDMAPVLVQHDFLRYVYCGCESKYCIKRGISVQTLSWALRAALYRGEGGTILWS